MRDRQFWFRVKVTDESLMFERVDVEAEGLYSKMRRDAFKGEPRGFLVDFRGAPLSFEDMADGYRMTNGRFKARLSELHDRGIIQTASEFGVALRTLRSAWASKKVSAFTELLSRVQGTPDDVYVIPSMIDDALDGMVGKHTGETGWEEGPDGKKRRKKNSETPLAIPIGTPTDDAKAGVLLLHSQSQSSESVSNSQSSSSPSRERESSAAHARGDQSERPMPWSVYTARCHEVSVWQKRQPEKQSPESFEAAFEAEFQFTWPTWSEIKRAMESAIPAPCRDGHHVFDGGSSCSYCPFIRVGETA